MRSRFYLNIAVYLLLLCSVCLHARIRLALLPGNQLPTDNSFGGDILLTQTVSWEAVTGHEPILLPDSQLPTLLRILLPDVGRVIDDKRLDQLELFLQRNSGIDGIILDLQGQKPSDEQLNYLLKQISSLIKGVRTGISLALDAASASPLIEPIVNQKLSSYLDALVVPSSDGDVQERIMTRLPELKLWERLDLVKGAESSSAELITRLLNRPLFMSSTTSLYLFEVPADPQRLQILQRLLPYLHMGLIDHMDTVEFYEEDHSSRSLPLYYKHDGVSPVIMAVVQQAGKKTLNIGEGVYESARITDLGTGEQTSEKIGKRSRNLKMNLGTSTYVIELFPRDQLKREVIKMGVSSERKISAEEIVAKARSWMAVQNRKLHTFTAELTVNYSLKVGNLNETFDLLIRGPYFSARGEPADWVQQEFYLNRIKWKSKKIPKIPLLQPEKVNIVPLEIELSEQYQYHRGQDDTVSGSPVFIIRFKPGTQLQDKTAYEGRLWIRKTDGAIMKKELTQLNLNGEALSNIETQFLSPLNEEDGVWLATRLVGHQIFNIAGTLTHIEKQIQYDKVRLNPEDYEERRQEALNSDARMVRDTEKGLRYLVKDPKTGERTVEWKQSKTQTAAIFGSFYDSSYTFPVPLAGINYLNFDLGGNGEGKQTHILFGGAMILANYTNPSLFDSKISFNANINGIAFASKNKIFRDLELSPEETIKEQTFKSFISLGFSLNQHIKLAAVFNADYYIYTRYKEDTAEEFVLPKDNLTCGLKLKLDTNIRGFSLSVWSEYGWRSQWDFWGLPANTEYEAQQRSFLRFRFIVSKDFQMSMFRKLQTKFTWVDGYKLDRFSAYKFGFFSELRVSGFNSGTIRAERALMLNLAYSYRLSEYFGLEFKYDSVLVSNRYEKIKRQYFSGMAVAASTALPFWDNMLMKFEVGLPVVSHGIKGFVLYLLLLKMF